MSSALSCELEIKAVPRSSRQKLELQGEVLKVWVTAPPVDGEANRAIEEAVAKALSLAKSQCAIISGSTSRSKRIRIVGIDREEAMNRLRGDTLF